MFEIITTNQKKKNPSDYDLRITGGDKIEFSPEFFEARNLNNNALNYGKIGDGFGFQITPEGAIFKKREGAVNKSKSFSNPTILAKLKEYGVSKFTLRNVSEGVYVFAPIYNTTSTEVVAEETVERPVAEQPFNQ
jgi:hypothetical protein